MFNPYHIFLYIVLLDLESHQILNNWGSSRIAFLDSNTWGKKNLEKGQKNILVSKLLEI
jgi:hypothetical protein